jgi:hypothetical protein
MPANRNTVHAFLVAGGINQSELLLTRRHDKRHHVGEIHTFRYHVPVMRTK